MEMKVEQLPAPPEPAADAAPNSPSADEIEVGLGKLKGKDAVGRAGEVLGTIGGSVAGASAAGAIASMAGASTILGSTSLGSILGGVLVTTTPVGWIIGSAALAGAAGYGIARMIRSGERHDGIRKQLATGLRQKLDSMRNVGPYQAKLTHLRLKMDAVVDRGLVTGERAAQMLSLVERKLLTPEAALVRVLALLAATPNQK